MSAGVDAKDNINRSKESLDRLLVVRNHLWGKLCQERQVDISFLELT